MTVGLGNGSGKIDEPWPRLPQPRLLGLTGCHIRLQPGQSSLLARGEGLGTVRTRLGFSCNCRDRLAELARGDAPVQLPRQLRCDAAGQPQRVLKPGHSMPVPCPNFGTRVAAGVPGTPTATRWQHPASVWSLPGNASRHSLTVLRTGEAGRAPE